MPFRWRENDQLMTPRQRAVLEKRGYQAEDLAGMPQRVASRHIGGELSPEDAYRSRGQQPPTNSAMEASDGRDQRSPP